MEKFKSSLFLAIFFLITSSSVVLALEVCKTTPIIAQDGTNITGKEYWIIYDNVCPYCKSAAKNIKELDWERRFKFISYRDPITYKMFPNLTKEECEKDVHMVTPKGEVLAGYKVFRTVIDNLTATKILNPILHNDFAEKELNSIYEKMVKKRTCYYNKNSGACGLKK